MPALSKPVPGLGAVTIVVTLDEFHKPALTEGQQQMVRELFPKMLSRGHWAKGRINTLFREEMVNTARVEIPDVMKEIDVLLDGITFEYRVKEVEKHQGQPPEKEGESH